jgi:hypothetical protein
MADETKRYKTVVPGDLLLADDFNELQDWVQDLHKTQAGDLNDLQTWVQELHDAHVEELHRIQNTGNKLVIKNSDKPVAMINGEAGNTVLGGNSIDGSLYCLPSRANWTEEDTNSSLSSVSTICLNGDIGKIEASEVSVGDPVNTESSVHISASGIDIRDIFLDGQPLERHKAAVTIRGNVRCLGSIVTDLVFSKGQLRIFTSRLSDIAEEFEVESTAEAAPGTAVVMDTDSKAIPTSQPYNRKILGVISGAGEYNPGIVLASDPSKPNRMPVSLMGKVYCKVDADYAPIELGDLLTTSATPGHAMKATDMTRAFGAVLGKAMAPLESGKGLIPIIVTLQ